ncbi:zinc finger protein 543-like [Condylostylus longicornis]|uniref:zinc finger protein 543-like n=1 Tax=Condylostylus longicornis TaxID=2530218 RepID=UPI00244E0493|nr:zinc finger protein 543-like [Condylostylus longicornis]
MTSLENDLRIKKICRFCLNQDEKLLTNLYSRENRLNNSAPLPLQVMACVSIEVFTNDGMPSTVCDICRMLMEHCYRFKQMCKKADTALRQYPLTGKWPPKLDHPKVPDELVNFLYPEIDLGKSEQKFSEFTVVTSPEKPEKQKMHNNGKSSNAPKQKLLNKNPVKILNKDVSVAMEPVFRKPVIKHSSDGTVELITEIIDTGDFQEIDPIKSAEPVKTNVFPCSHCDRSFPLRQLLDIHMVNHNRERNFQCEDCDKKFFTKYDLGKHSLIHSNEKPFKCVVCEKSFTRATLLLRHEKVHTDVPKFLCVHCEKPFISKEVLAKHTERHNKKRPFPCKICKASFAFKQGLERHESVHAKEQPFPCQYCNLSFPTPSKLARHLTAHAGARPYPCKICSKAYLLSHHLTRHLRSHREGDVNFKCYDCGKSFNSRDNLIYHSAVHATQNLLCPICKEQFEDVDSVTDHIKMHAVGEQYACEYCDLIFMTQTKLEGHCNSDHAEEIAVYAELEKPNIKNESAQEETGEIIQEFVIEEYDVNLLNEDQIIKEEIILENDIISEIAQLNEKGKKKAKNNEQKTNKNVNKRTYSPDFNLDDFTEEESVLFEELIQEQPPSKIFLNESEEQAGIDTKKPKTQEKRNPKPKMKQTTLTAVIENNPNTTVHKKEKDSEQPVVEFIKSENPDNNSTNKVKSLTTQRSNKTLNKSNEKINISGKSNSELPKMIKIGNKHIQVKQINLTKAQEKSIAEQGKINFNKDRKVVSKQDTNKKKVIRNP